MNVCRLEDPSNHPAITGLYRQWGERVKCGKRDRVYTLWQGELCLAAARVVLQADQSPLLRNLTTCPDWRRQGCARQLMQFIVNDPAMDSLYCYALSYLKVFYESLGFSALSVPGSELMGSLNISTVPESILKPYQGYIGAGKRFVLMARNK